MISATFQTGGKARSPLPIYVDEDCHTLADVVPCGEIAHGINIKLAKSGGIREAVRMAHAARAMRMGLGAMVNGAGPIRGRSFTTAMNLVIVGHVV